MRNQRWTDRQGTCSNPSHSENGIRKGRSDPYDRGFAGAYGRQILPINQQNVHGRNIAEARDAVLRENIVYNPAIFKFDCFKQCPAQTHDVCTNQLIAQPIRIHDCTAIERGQNALNPDLSTLRFQAYFDKRSDIPELFKSAAHAKPVIYSWRAVPAELLSAFLEDGSQSFVLQIVQPEFQRIDLQ